jgi:hypothetical protein
VSTINSEPSYQPERRLHARYLVRGSLVLDTERGRYEAQLVNLSLGGILFSAERLPPVDTPGMLQLNLDGFDEVITANVRVVRTWGILGAAILILPGSSLERCMEWLARRAL